MEKDLKTTICGIMFVYYDKVLLVHTSDKTEIGYYSIPKGHLKENEKIIEGAIREVYEETGIKVDKNKLGEQYKLKQVNGKTLFYYIYEIKDLKEIGLKHTIIKKKKLQLEEIDWAGFISIRQAKKVINPMQSKILDTYVNNTATSKYIINYDRYSENPIKN